MIYNLSEALKENLSSRPETGMGYQIINLNPTPQFRMEKALVINSDLLIDLDNQATWSAINQIKSYEQIKLSAKEEVYLSDLNIKSIEISLKSTNYFLSVESESICERKAGGNGAMQSPIRSANGNESFVRLSHFRKDNRVDEENKCLKKGSFATSVNDYLTCVYCPDDPNDRYALPNDDPILWAFFVTPKNTDNLQEGIVQQANNKRGGGYEAYFKNGTSINTLGDTRRYGK